MTIYSLSKMRHDGSRVLTASFKVNGLQRRVAETVNTKRPDFREAVTALTAHVEMEKAPVLRWRSAQVKRGLE